MRAILFAKFTSLYRNPWTFIAMTVLTIVFALIIGGSSVSKESVPVYNNLDDQSFVLHVMKENDVFDMEMVSKVELEDNVKRGNSDFGLILLEDGYELVAGVESPFTYFAKQMTEEAYAKNEQFAALIGETGNESEKIQLYDMFADDPVFNVVEQSESNQAVTYDNQLSPLFGMALFLVIYTIAYSVFEILVEKKSGVWDRMILSPAKKTDMYTANFIYSSIVGYVQISLIFLIFKYIFGVDFGGRFGLVLLVTIPYVLAIVALIIFIVGVVKSVQQFNVIITSIAVSMAMLGGSFWPLDIVESNTMLLLSRVIPIRYGLDLLNGVTGLGYTVTDMLQPIAILLLMSVVLTGIGIHLMEKRFIS